VSPFSSLSITKDLTRPYRRGGEVAEIPLGPKGAQGKAPCRLLEFRDYVARHGEQPPDPRYVIVALKSTGREPLTVECGYFEEGAKTALEKALSPAAAQLIVSSAAGFPVAPFDLRIDDEVITVTGGAGTTWSITRSRAGTLAQAHVAGSVVRQALPEKTVTIAIPALAPEGTSFAVPPPQNPSPSDRLLWIRTLPSSSEEQDAWQVAALLGTFAKLGWVMGWEKDQIAHQLQDVQEQRRRPLARSHSLDRLGEDLQIPRFPPKEYSFDRMTIALYHLNDRVADGAAVPDETARFGLAGHPGVNEGASSGAIGKFGRGFRFPGPSGKGAVTIATHADFDVAANADFTAEAFVLADSIDDATPRTILMRGSHDGVLKLTSAGWSLAYGNFRGIAGNLRWTLSDGAKEREIFADVGIANGRFHHVAATVDRNAKRARLFVDGTELASCDIDPLGGLTNGEPVRIGRSSTGHQFPGVLDEIRFSRTPRAVFEPVLGEGDEPYRERLGIFEEWHLPTPDELLRMINSRIVINGDKQSFVLIEKTRPHETATKALRIIPASLRASQSIDREGRIPGNELDASGSPTDDPLFKPEYLLRHDDARATYGDENSRRMQFGLKVRFDRLLSLLEAETVAGKVIVEAAYVPADAGLHRVGRALRIRHGGALTPSQLGVFAHRAGFDYVRNEGPAVYLSSGPGPMLEIAPESTIPETGLAVGAGVDLHVAPTTLSAQGAVRWTLILCGKGRAHFEAHPSDPVALATPVATRPRLRLITDAPGDLSLSVEYTRQGQTVGGSRLIRIAPSALNDGSSIAADGSIDLIEKQIVKALDETVNSIYLIDSGAPVNFGADPNHRKMQQVLEKPLGRLTALLGGQAGGLEILKGYDLGGPGPHRSGRALLMKHGATPAGTLGALAHQAGFDFVRRQGNEIYASVGPGPRVEIAKAPLAPLGDELTINTPVDLRLRLDPLPGSGAYNWSLQTMDRGHGSFDFILRPQIQFTPKACGYLALHATYLEQDTKSVLPYTFEIRLNSVLDKPQTLIPKDKYDLLMNILNYFHPIGVEVVTRNIREHVVEVKDNLLNAFPGYTYPDFRR
jgi:hypothetical protein